GDPVLLLHGFPQTGECWRGVVARLAPRHRLIVPDLPGFGRSGRPRSYDAAAVAETLADLLDAVGVPRATIVGHDWGGSTALAYAAKHPRRVIGRVVRPRSGGTAGASRKIEAPTLIVWGMRDPALPASVLESIEHDIPTASVVRLVDVGHCVPDEAPDELSH